MNEWNGSAAENPTNVPPAHAPYNPAPFICDRADCGLLPLALLLGILLREWIFLSPYPGIAVWATIAALYLVVFWYGKKSARFTPRAGALFGIPIVLTLFCFVLFHNPFLAFWNLLLLYALVTMHISRMFGYSVRDLLPQFVCSAFRAPFANLGAAPKAILQLRKNTRSGNVWRIACGLVIAIPIGTIVLALLCSADDAFSNALQDLQNNVGSLFGRFVIDLIVGSLIALVLFSFFYTVRHQAPQTARPHKTFQPDSVIIATVLAVCATIYVCFFVVQFQYLFSAVWGSLPGDAVYSAYARRGFFELLTIAFINLILVLLATRSAQASTPVMRGIVVLLALQTLLLIASAAAKMIMYVNVFGMSPLRVYASWFMIVVAFVFIVLLLAQFARKIHIFNTLCGGILILFLLLNFAAPNRMIAQWNARHYLNGTLAQMDVSLLESLGPEAVPSLVMLSENATDPAVGRLANNALHRMHVQLEQNTRWTAWNLPAHLAMPFDREIISPKPQSLSISFSNDTAIPLIEAVLDFDCNGQILFSTNYIHTDFSPILPNEQITFDCPEQIFPESIDWSEIAVHTAIISAEGEELFAGKILFAPSFGATYTFTLFGDHSCGFSLIDSNGTVL